VALDALSNDVVLGWNNRYYTSGLLGVERRRGAVAVEAPPPFLPV
jgi:hypothetical protein